MALRTATVAAHHFLQTAWKINDGHHTEPKHRRHRNHCQPSQALAPTQPRYTQDGQVLLDRLGVKAGGAHTLDIAAGDLIWVQILDGSASSTLGGNKESLTQAHIMFLPPGFRGTLTSATGVTLLQPRCPTPYVWTQHLCNRRRLLKSSTGHANRYSIPSTMRVSVSMWLHRKLFATMAIKCAMIIYPPGTEASNHHHEGVRHFMYVLQGRGTADANETPIPVCAGDLISLRRPRTPLSA